MRGSSGRGAGRRVGAAGSLTDRGSSRIRVAGARLAFRSGHADPGAAFHPDSRFERRSTLMTPHSTYPSGPSALGKLVALGALGLVGFVLPACAGDKSAAAGKPADPKAAVVAEVAGKTVTMADLEASVAPQLCADRPAAPAAARAGARPPGRGEAVRGRGGRARHQQGRPDPGRDHVQGRRGHRRRGRSSGTRPTRPASATGRSSRSDRRSRASSASRSRRACASSTSPRCAASTSRAS